jgi:ADP-ribose pyrophosphatase
MQINSFSKSTDNKWLNLYSIHYTDRRNNAKQWQLASRRDCPRCISKQFSEPDAVVIVAQHSDSRKLVVTREFRVALADYEYGLPAGLIDPGETLQDATRRELAEETGLEVSQFLTVSPPIYSSTGMSDEAVSMVYINCRGEPSNDGNQDSEIIEVLMLTPAEVTHLLDTPQIKYDAKAWLVFRHFAQTGSI